MYNRVLSRGSVACAGALLLAIACIATDEDLEGSLEQGVMESSDSLDQTSGSLDRIPVEDDLAMELSDEVVADDEAAGEFYEWYPGDGTTEDATTDYQELLPKCKKWKCCYCYKGKCSCCQYDKKGIAQECAKDKCKDKYKKCKYKYCQCIDKK